jgi:putative spermidine/putrescine transport system permease protein
MSAPFRPQSRRRRGVVEKALIYVGYAVIIIPLVVLLIWVFAGRWPWPELLPSTFSLRTVTSLFGASSKALPVLGSSVAISGVVALLSIAVSLPAARVLVLADFRGKRLLQYAVLLPVIVPATAFAMGVHLLFIPLKLNDSLVGVILIHVILCLPYTVRILTQVTEATGDRLESQARLLGASPWDTLIHITVPGAMPGIVSSACMAFIVSFSQYFVTLLIGGGRVVTYAMFMFPFINGGDRSMAAVYSAVFIVAAMLVFILFDRLTRRYYKLDNIVFYG